MPLDPSTALLFLHIPKTAGTSLLAALDELYPQEERVHLYDRQPDSMHPRDFAELPLERRSELRFVAGHFRYGLHELIPRPCTYITVLREPVDRLQSLYYHHKMIRGSTYHQRIVDEDLDFAGFVLSDNIEQTDNDMVRFLSGVRRAIGRCDEGMLAAAREHIDQHFDAVLVQERMDESLAFLGSVLGRDIHLDKRNVGTRPASSGIAPEVLRAIEERVWLDAKLYEYARARIANRPG